MGEMGYHFHGHFFPFEEVLGIAVYGGDVFQDYVTGGVVSLAGFQHAFYFVSGGFLVGVEVGYVCGIGFEGHDVFAAHVVCSNVCVRPGGYADFADVGDLFYDVYHIMERLAASIVYQAEGFHGLFHVLDVKFVPHFFGYC